MQVAIFREAFVLRIPLRRMTSTKGQNVILAMKLQMNGSEDMIPFWNKMKYINIHD